MFAVNLAVLCTLPFSDDVAQHNQRNVENKKLKLSFFEAARCYLLQLPEERKTFP